MHNRKVFVFQDLNYAASKTSATQNTAVTPDLLADGSVAIYGIQEGGSTNVNKLVLITDGGSETAGVCPAASFSGKEVFLAMGTARNVELSNPIQLTAGLQRAVGTKYVAPVRGTIVFGYNGTAGTSFNFPATINRGDDFQIQLFNRNYFVAGGREPGQKVILSAQASQGDTQYTVLTRWVAAVNLRLDDILIDKTTIKITNGTGGSVIGNSATAAVVNGSNSVTTSAAHLVTVGQFISFAGDTYKAITGTTGSTIILDRVYQGATNAAMANAVVLNTASTTEPTLLGLSMSDGKDFYNIDGAVKGLALNATILRTVFPSPGEGSYAGILAYEKEALPKKGTEALIDATIPHDIYRANAALTYDVYILTTHNRDQPNGDQGAVFKVIMYITLAFVSGVADTTNKAQSDFEDAMTSLFGATFPQISA